jgi:hypothetical protein
MNESSDDDYGSNSDGEDQEVFQMYKKAFNQKKLSRPPASALMNLTTSDN